MIAYTNKHWLKRFKVISLMNRDSELEIMIKELRKLDKTEQSALVDFVCSNDKEKLLLTSLVNSNFEFQK